MTRMDAMNTNEIYFLCLISIMPAQAKLKQITFALTLILMKINCSAIFNNFGGAIKRMPGIFLFA